MKKESFRFLSKLPLGALALAVVTFLTFFGGPVANGQVVVDSDHDGMDDGWEQSHFGGLSRDGSGDYDGDLISDADEYTVNTDPTLSQPLSVGESGKVTVRQVDRSQWHEVKLSGVYTNPVVVMGPPSSRDYEAVTLKVRNVSPNRFEFQIATWGLARGSHDEETISYLVVEAGRHILTGGTVVEAGYSLVAGGANTSVNYSVPFSATPAMLTQVTSQNDSRPVVVREDSGQASQIDLTLQNSQAQQAVSPHSQESVAWIAWSVGSNQVEGGGTFADRSAVKFTDEFMAETFPPGLANVPPVVVASLASLGGADPATLRYRNLSEVSVEFKVQEETSLNNGTAHGAERIGYVAMPAGPFQFLATPADTNADGVANAWQVEQGLLDSESGLPVSGLTAFDAGYFGDPDGDGVINGNESIMGSRPLVKGGFPGLFTRDKWGNIPGSEVADLYVSDAFYRAPSSSDSVMATEGPREDVDQYGSRLRGTVVVPVAGKWRFFLAADDAAELWVSVPGDKFHKRKVAEVDPLEVGGKGGTGYRSWYEFSSQRSDWMDLEAGQEIFVEALHIQVKYAAHVSVAW